MARTRPRRVRTDAPTCKIGRVAGHDIAALGIWVQACKVPQICCDRRDMPGLRSLHRRVQLRYGAGRDIQRKAWAAVPSVVPAQGNDPAAGAQIAHSLGAAHAAKVSQQQCILAKTVALRDENGCAVGKVFLLQRRRLLSNRFQRHAQVEQAAQIKNSGPSRMQRPKSPE